MERSLKWQFTKQKVQWENRGELAELEHGTENLVMKCGDCLQNRGSEPLGALHFFVEMEVKTQEYKN